MRYLILLLLVSLPAQAKVFKNVCSAVNSPAQRKCTTSAMMIEDFRDISDWTNNSNAELGIIDLGLQVQTGIADTLDLVMDSTDLSAFNTIRADVEVTDIAADGFILLTVTDADGIEFTDQTPTGETGTFTLEVDVSDANLISADVTLTTETDTVLDVIINPIRGLF